MNGESSRDAPHLLLDVKDDTMRVTEETLEQEVAAIFGEIFGGDIVTQVRTSGRRKPDIVMRFAEHQFVLELELGGQRKFIEAITQGYAYAQSLDAEGIIVLVYPESARRTIAGRSDVRDIVEQTHVSALVLSPFLTRHFSEVYLRDFAEKLKATVTTKETAVDVGLVTNVLREAVELLSLQLRRAQQVSKPALDVVINRFELFQALSLEEKTKDKAMARDLNAVACDLAAYVLVNQILLYHLLTKPLALPMLKPLHGLTELKESFERVLAVDYKAVYHVDVVSRLPKTALNPINKIILAIQYLKSESVPHDLLGRLFHEFLPFETRKQLATFYTRPIAAEMLATLAIQDPKGIVIDLACGSGTLLVSAYRRKQALSPKTSHRALIGKEIYGIDIMPFAAHLAALNLTLQNLDEVTDTVNIGVGNALDLETGSTLPGQIHLFPVTRKRADVDLADQAKFQLPKHVRLVIMNPPYTDRKRLAGSMLGSKAQAFTKAQNYWAYFIKLADEVLDESGRIAAVLPRLFLSGSFSREVREWLFKHDHYTLRYIVRTCREIAFSEAAQFRDYLIVMDKGKQNDRCGVVYLKASLRELTLDEARDITERISHVKPGSAYSDRDVQVTWVAQKTIRENWKNLGSLVSFEDADNARVLSEFFQTFVEKAEGSLAYLQDVPFVTVKRGFEPKPAGLYDAVFAVRPTDGKRAERSQLIIQSETAQTITALWRGANQPIRIPRNAVMAGIKTASYLGTWRINHNADWIITERFKGFRESIETLAGIHVDFHYVNEFNGARLAHLIVAKRIDLAAPGTSVLAFYADERIASANVCYSVITNPTYAKGLCLYLNSVLGILQYLTLRMETRGSYCDLLQETLVEDVRVPTPETIERHKKELDALMDRFGAVTLPSLVNQLTNPPPARKRLDRLILKMCGWTDPEIEEALPRVYKALSSELKLLAAAMSEKSEDHGADVL